MVTFFRDSRLYILNTSLIDHLIYELHVGDTIGHFNKNKTIILMEDGFY